MEDAIKSRLILILGLACAMLLIINIGSCSNAYRQKSGRDKEMARRLELEEQLTKFQQERGKVDSVIKAKDTELAEAKASLETIKNSLVQEQLVNTSLKEELQRLTKLKEALEKDLKEALVSRDKIKK